MISKRETDVVVVGGGVIGSAVADSLTRRGLGVVVVDAGVPRAGTSLANAGMIACSDVISFAAPGMIGAGIRAMVHRDGAFRIDSQISLTTIRWLAAFARSCTQTHVAASVEVLRYLLGATRTGLDEFPSSDVDFAPSGVLHVHRSKRSWRRGDGHRAELRRLGVDLRELTATQLHELEPMLRNSHAAYETVNDVRVDPALLVKSLVRRARERGARRIQATTSTVTPGADGVTVATSAGEWQADQVVIAAGAWSSSLTRRLGVALPIAAAKGHSMTLSLLPEAPSRPLLLEDEHVAITPLSRGLRVTGGFELTRADDRGIEPAKIKSILRTARAVLALPDDVTPENVWTGVRPVTPDGLPVVDRLTKHSRVVVAAGHGILGTSMSLGTGELVAKLVAGEPADVDMDRLSVARFTQGTRRA